MKLIGAVMLIVCGSGLGLCISAAYRERTVHIERVSEMLLQMQIMLGHELPTVEQMIRRLSAECDGMPCFIQNAASREDVLNALRFDPDSFDRRSCERLTAFFRQLGSADKEAEEERIAALRAYFIRLAETERPKNEQKAKLARSLGTLGGIFAAILLF